MMTLQAFKKFLLIDFITLIKLFMTYSDVLNNCLKLSIGTAAADKLLKIALWKVAVS